jgi:hypothetical protein
MCEQCESARYFGKFINKESFSLEFTFTLSEGIVAMKSYDVPENSICEVYVLRSTDTVLVKFSDMLSPTNGIELEGFAGLYETECGIEEFSEIWTPYFEGSNIIN